MRIRLLRDWGFGTKGQEYDMGLGVALILIERRIAEEVKDAQHAIQARPEAVQNRKKRI